MKVQALDLIAVCIPSKFCKYRWLLWHWCWCKCGCSYTGHKCTLKMISHWRI